MTILSLSLSRTESTYTFLLIWIIFLRIMRLKSWGKKEEIFFKQFLGLHFSTLCTRYYAVSFWYCHSLVLILILISIKTRIDNIFAKIFLKCWPQKKPQKWFYTLSKPHFLGALRSLLYYYQLVLIRIFINSQTQATPFRKNQI